MKRLNQLHDIADRQLAGVVADDQLKARILERAKPRPVMAWRPMLAGATAFALCVAVALWAFPTASDDQPPTPTASAVLFSGSAGGEDPVDRPLVRSLDIPNGSVTITDGTSAPSYRSIFEPEQNGNFPLVLVDGAAYRLLTTPSSVGDSLLGDSLGEVTEFTLEPALSNGGTVSNVVSAGETIYAIDGMQSAMVAANVNGVRRVFQRVSFAGKAIVGSESLEDALVSANRVTALELSDVGAIDDAQEAQSLMQTLLDNASFSNASASGSGRQSLLIHLDNGLILQTIVGDDCISSCGTWSCPDFFEAFNTALME